MWKCAASFKFVFLLNYGVKLTTGATIFESQISQHTILGTYDGKKKKKNEG
jgi:hypothetical protein